MLYLAVLLGIVLWVVLYIWWVLTQPYLGNLPALMLSLRSMVLGVPDSTLMMVVRNTILMAIALLLFEFLTSWVRRSLRQRALRLQREQEYDNQWWNVAQKPALEDA